ncbi:uncharacterized protein LOC128178159 isoform X2 [Crassostrea angulata]|uniref:uncharacterized protein LOC128178159 isoform X2 n=1 Tax=Magallana angulata TaxID=2784310 RepID=UPI0022B15B65|nr:uncharacterized protein LOC128178159 isoform X2 [Crassostrea angulata]
MQKTRRVSLKYCHRDEVNLKREKENNEEEEEEEEEDKVNVKGGFFPKHIRQHTTHFGKDRLKMSMLSLKRQNKVAGIGARSLTLDSLKLPSLCTASSVITTSTHTSGPNVAPKSDVIPNAKKTVGIQVTIHFMRWKFNETQIKEKEKDLSSSLSRSLPNIATAVQNDAKPASKHRFERISYSKKLQTRSVEKKDKEDEQAVTEAPSNSLQELEKSGIYHIDLSNLTGVVHIQKDIQSERIDRGEVLNFQNRSMSTIRENSPFTARSSADIKSRLEKDRLGRRSRRKKWKDNCKCMRCEIMKRQFTEGDDHYSKWGIYPCQQFNRKKYFNQYFYDSD